MRLVSGDVNVYYYHDTLSPHTIRAASYGTASTSGALVPEVGDVLHNFPGWTGEEYEPITVRVIDVKMIGVGVEAYEVRTTTIAGGTWRVQLFSRCDIGEPERAEGRHDFDSEAEARDYLGSDEVQGRIGAFWRAELLYIPPAAVVASEPFREPEPADA